ncbi:MAG: hypothetical protein U0228_06570 [Myxococcaceae bacterium]
MAPKEKPLSPARRLARSLPKPGPKLREACAALWTDAQCDAWGRRAKPKDAWKQACDWLLVADAALRKAPEDLPYSRARLAWLAELTVQLEDELSGAVTGEQKDARARRDARLGEAKKLRARALSRLQLCVGGEEDRGAALAVANKGSRNAGEVAGTLVALGELMDHWRKRERLRVLLDELGLDDDFIEAMERAAKELQTAVADAETLAGHATHRLAGRLLRELRALQLAFETARAEGLAVPRNVLPLLLRGEGRGEE